MVKNYIKIIVIGYKLSLELVLLRIFHITINYTM